LQKRVRPIYSSAKDAILVKFDIQNSLKNVRFGTNFSNDYEDSLRITEFLKKEDLQWLGWNWLLTRVGVEIRQEEKKQKSRKKIFIKMIE